MTDYKDRMGWDGEDDMEGVSVEPPSGPDMEPDHKLLAEIERVKNLLAQSGFESKDEED